MRSGTLSRSDGAYINLTTFNSLLLNLVFLFLLLALNISSWVVLISFINYLALLTVAPILLPEFADLVYTNLCAKCIKTVLSKQSSSPPFLLTNKRPLTITKVHCLLFKAVPMMMWHLQ